MFPWTIALPPHSARMMIPTMNRMAAATRIVIIMLTLRLELNVRPYLVAH